MNTFYLPLSSQSLAHYFNRALILPAIYFSNRPADIQNKLKNKILFSNKKWVKNCDCSLEIVFAESEINVLKKINENFYEYENSLPISRIKTINFLDEKQKETTIWNINSGAAFIPEDLIKIEMKHDSEIISDEILTNSDESTFNDTISEKINLFDKLLGSFAFLKVSTRAFMNYPTNYFSTLSYFNEIIKEQINRVEKSEGLTLTYRLWDLFEVENSSWKKWQSFIFGKVGVKDVESIAENEGISIEKKFGTISLTSIPKENQLYDLAVLSIYGDNKNKSADDLVTDILNGIIPSEKAEDVSFLFGLNTGYARLRNKYKTLSKEINVKFKLDSKLDYYTIESIYQFVFNDEKRNYSFSYLDEWCPIKDINESIKGYDTYRMLDVMVISKKKETLLDIFMENYSKSIYLKIIDAINQWLPPFVKSEEKDAINHFEKILGPTLIEVINDLEIKVELDSRHQFNSEKNILIDDYETKIKNLEAEISALKEEKHKFKLENDNLLKKDIDLNDSKLTKESSSREPKREEENLDIQNSSDNSNLKNIIQESDPSSSANLKTLSAIQLKSIAKSKGIKKWNKMKKEELIEALTNNEYRLL